MEYLIGIPSPWRCLPRRYLLQGRVQERVYARFPPHRLLSTPPVDVTLPERNGRAPENPTAGHSTCSVLTLMHQKWEHHSLVSPPAPTRGRGDLRVPSRHLFHPTLTEQHQAQHLLLSVVLRTNAPFQQSLLSRGPAPPRPRDAADN